MVIVEAIAVSTMVCNDLVMPCCCARCARCAGGRDLTRLLLASGARDRRCCCWLCYLYFPLAGEAYALVSIGLISFAAVAQFAPALLAGMYWKGGTRAGRLAGPAGGLRTVGYTLMLPSIAKSGWLPAASSTTMALASAMAGPSSCSAWQGFDGLTHSLFWSCAPTWGLYVGRRSLAPAVGARDQPGPAVRRRVRARRPSSRCSGAAAQRSSRPARAGRRFLGRARRSACSPTTPGGPARAASSSSSPTRSSCSSSRPQLAGAIGSAVGAGDGGLGGQGGAARARRGDVNILDEASQLRAYGALEEKSLSLERGDRRTARRQRAA